MKRIFWAAGAVAVLGLGAAAVAMAHPHHGGWRGGHGGYERGDHMRGHMRGQMRGEGRGGRMRAEIDRLFEEADADGDGAISLEELAADRAARFEAMDADASGGVDAEELVAYRQRQRAERRIRRLDLNEDGVLSIDELPDFSRRFERFDLDENGSVTRTEIEAAVRSGRGFGRRGEGRRRGPRDEVQQETPEQ